ncbi:MAG TPA: hypothetical protein VGE35_00970 [Candidatus Paceibacterota bacterium]
MHTQSAAISEMTGLAIESVEHTLSNSSKNPRSRSNKKVKHIAAMREIAKIRDTESAKRAYLAYPHGSYEQARALKRWNTLAKRKAKAATDLLEIRLAYRHAPPGSTSQALARERWNRIATDRIKEATQALDVRRLMQHSPPDSPARDLAFRKYLSLATKQQVVWIVKEHSPGEYQHILAVRRLAEILEQEF